MDAPPSPDLPTQHNMTLAQEKNVILLHTFFQKFSREFYFREKHLNTYLPNKKSRLELDSPTTVNGRVISPFREDFILAKLRIREVRENKPSRNFLILQHEHQRHRL